MESEPVGLKSMKEASDRKQSNFLDGVDGVDEVDVVITDTAEFLVLEDLGTNFKGV